MRLILPGRITVKTTFSTLASGIALALASFACSMPAGATHNGADGTPRALLRAPAQVAMAGNAARPQQPNLVVTRNFNLVLIHPDGSSSPVTTRGTGYNGIYYPSYSWSPDGKYLAVLRATVAGNAYLRGDLLLLDSTGKALRTLAQADPEADFPPTWASDGDQIAFAAAPSGDLRQPMRHVVERVDMQGHAQPLFTYSSHEGCGGGTSDAAEQRYFQAIGGFGIAPRMQWSLTAHRALYTASCAGGVNLTDTRTGATQKLASVDNTATLSPSGVLAGMLGRNGAGTSQIAIGRLGSEAYDVAATGELPLWSNDGKYVYFVQRTQGGVYPLTDALGNRNAFPIYTSAVWRLNADGSNPVRLLSESAFGFGPLQSSRDGHLLFFERIDNNTALWQHRLPGNRYTQALAAQYPPAISVLRLDLSGPTATVTTVAMDAGQPAVQP